MAKHRANSNGASVGGGGLTNQISGKAATGAGTGKAKAQTSIFDPVLAELAYRWFSPEGGRVLDPFAGGSVRGIVAGKLGRDYVGIDLRAEQVEANRLQAVEILSSDEQSGAVEWHIGDSGEVLTTDIIAGIFDMVFTCPPYADLEVYSYHHRDISAMPYKRFFASFTDIMKKSVDKLAENRFVVIVIGDARDKKTGFYYGLPAHTIKMMQNLGLGLLNEMILLTPPGSLPGRSRGPMQQSRKVGRAHQSVLVFCKGDPVAAAKAIGNIDFGQSIDPLADHETDDPSVNPFAGLGDLL